MVPLIMLPPFADKFFRHRISDDLELRIEPNSTRYTDYDVTILSEWVAAHTATAFSAIVSGKPVTFCIQKQEVHDAAELLSTLSSLRFDIRRPSFERALSGYFEGDKAEIGETR